MFLVQRSADGAAKVAIVKQSFEAGMTVGMVVRQHGVAASHLFLWRK